MNNMFFPKLLTSPTALASADLDLVIKDLIHVKECCNLILGEKHCMLGSVKGKAFLDSLSIRYRRCFTRGVRARLNLNDLKIEDSDRELHDFFYSLADKHIAHSVNNFELNATTLHIAVSADGKVTRGGLGSNGSETVNLAPYHIQQFGLFIDKLLQQTFTLKKKHSESLEKEVFAMTDEQIKLLPDGFAPIKDTPVVDQNRTWPKKK